jgi:Helix-turn-helix domain
MTPNKINNGFGCCPCAGAQPRFQSIMNTTNSNSLTPAVLPKLSFDLAETSQITGFSTRTIRRFVARGLLHPVKASRRLIFAKFEIDRFLQEMTTN